MGLSINIIISGGLILFGFLLMAGAAVYDMYDTKIDESETTEAVVSDTEGEVIEESPPGTNLFWIGLGAVALGIFFKYKGWGE